MDEQVIDDRALSTRQVAERMGVSIWHVRALVRTGQLEGVDVARRRSGGRPHRPMWRIPLASYRAFMRGEARAEARRPGRPRKRQTSHLPSWD